MTENRKILLVEDDPLVAHVVRLALPSLDVVVAETRERALELLASGTEWCGALVDLNLTEHYQDFRGRDVLEALRGTEIPRAVLTKAKGIGDIRRNFQLRYGVSTVVMKGDRGIELGDIRQCVADMIESSVGSQREILEQHLLAARERVEADYLTAVNDLESVRKRTQRISGSAAASRLVATDMANSKARRDDLISHIDTLLGRLSLAATRHDIDSVRSSLRPEVG